MGALYPRREKPLHYLLFPIWQREGDEAKRMLSNDPKADTFETALTEGGEEELKEEGKQAVAMSTAEGSFSSTTSTLSTSLPKASSTMKEVKETENQKDVIHDLDNTPLVAKCDHRAQTFRRSKWMDTAGIW